MTKKALMNRWQKIWARPPPLIWTKSKRTAVFPRETVPYTVHVQCAVCSVPVVCSWWPNFVLKCAHNVQCAHGVQWKAHRPLAGSPLPGCCSQSHTGPAVITTQPCVGASEQKDIHELLGDTRRKLKRGVIEMLLVTVSCRLSRCWCQRPIKTLDSFSLIYLKLTDKTVPEKHYDCWS